MMTTLNTTTGKEARFLIVKLNNLTERLEREGGLMLSDYTRGILNNPDRPAGGQVSAVRALAGVRTPTGLARSLADEIAESAGKLLDLTGWPTKPEYTPQGDDQRQTAAPTAPTGHGRAWNPLGLLRARPGIKTAAGVLASACR